MKIYLKSHANGVLNSAAKNLQVALCGPAYDIFACDVYYHQSYFLKFRCIHTQDVSQPTSIVDGNEEIVSVEFCTYVKVKILREKNACLLKELLEDVKNLWEEHEMGTDWLRRYLKKNYKNLIGFFHSGGQVIVYSAETNPSQYNVASILQCFSLRDRDLVKAFSTFPRKKILPRSARFQGIDEWPMSQNTLIQSFDEGTIQ